MKIHLCYCTDVKAVSEQQPHLLSSSLSSHPTSRELRDAGFNIQERGQIEVKGKGLMTTYFLLGNLLVSDDDIMGKEAGGICLYKDELHSQSTKGKSKEEKWTSKQNFNFYFCVI